MFGLFKSKEEKMRDKMINAMFGGDKNNIGKLADFIRWNEGFTEEESLELATRGFAMYEITMSKGNPSFEDVTNRLVDHFAGYTYSINLDETKSLHKIYQEFSAYVKIKPGVSFDKFHENYFEYLLKAMNR